MEYTILSFLKFGQEKYINDMFENGTIFMNPVQHFRDFDDGGLRGDPYEGASEVNNLPSGTLEIKELNYKGEYISIHYKKSLDVILGNLYCMYCVSSKGFPNPLSFKIDQKNMDFGEKCLMIYDSKTFLERMEKAMGSTNIEFHNGFVDYYDKKEYNGKLTLFQKPLEFEFQKEFRFYLASDETKPIILNIGSMKDIAKIHNTKDIIDTLQLVPQNEAK